MIPVAVVTILVGNLGIAAAVGTVDERAKLSYRVELSGANEVPPVATGASGRAALTWAVHGDFLKYEVQILNALGGTTQAHIHVGAPGANGPVVAFLFGPVTPTDIGRQVLANGLVRPENLVGPMAGNWSAFVAALEAGNLYINVHTSTHPWGEIRGQIERARGVRDSTTTLPPTTTTTLPPTTTTTLPPTTTTTLPPTTTTTLPPTTTTTLPPTTTTTLPPTTTTTLPPTTTTTSPPTTTTTLPPTQTEATMFEFDFGPDPIVVPVGRTVRWTNVGVITHTSTSPDGGWDSGLVGSGGTYSFTMNQAGTFDYFCTLHPGMEGSVVVGS